MPIGQHDERPLRACSITSVAFGEGTDPEERFRILHEAGFTHVHWADHCWDAGHYDSADEIAAIRSACRRYDLRIVDLHGIEASGTDAPFTDALWLDANSRRVTLAAELDAGCVVLHPADMPPEVSYDTVLDTTIRRLEGLRPIAERSGVRIAVENVYVRPPTVEFLDAVFERFGADYVGFCFDSGHALMTDRMHLLPRYADRLLALHLHDNDGKDDQHLIPGEGSIDWPAVMQQLRTGPYQGPLTLEVINRSDAEPAAWCRDAHRAVRAFWDNSAPD